MGIDAATGALTQVTGSPFAAGSKSYIAGSIPLAKAPFLAQKFAGRYVLNPGKIADHRALTGR